MYKNVRGNAAAVVGTVKGSRYLEEVTVKTIITL